MAPPQPESDTVEAAGAVSRLTRIRVLALAAAVPLIVGYAAVAGVLALVTAGARFAHFSVQGVLGAALPGWLAAHQVPLAIGGVEFGALPLLPTLGVLVLAARAAGRAAGRLGVTSPYQAVPVVGVVAGAHGVCGLAVALAQPGRLVEIDPLAAFYYPALLAGLGASVGVLRRGVAGAVAARVDDVALHGLVAGAVAVVLLLTAGAAVVTFGLVTSAATVRELFAGSAPGLGDGVGMVLLCVGYLPNAVVAGTAFVAGPGFAIGGLAVSPVEFSGGRVPGLPLLAALPEEQGVWWPVLCLVPVAVGVVVGRRLRDVAERPLTRVRGVAVAVGVVAVAFVLLAGSAGGRLGGGAFDPVTMRAAAVSVALVLAVGLPAVAVAWFGGPRFLPESYTESHEADSLRDRHGDNDGAADGGAGDDGAPGAGEVGGAGDDGAARAGEVSGAGDSGGFGGAGGAGGPGGAGGAGGDAGGPGCADDTGGAVGGFGAGGGAGAGGFGAGGEAGGLGGADDGVGAGGGSAGGAGGFGDAGGAGGPVGADDGGGAVAGVGAGGGAGVGGFGAGGEVGGPGGVDDGVGAGGGGEAGPAGPAGPAGAGGAGGADDGGDAGAGGEAGGLGGVDDGGGAGAGSAGGAVASAGAGDFGGVGSAEGPSDDVHGGGLAGEHEGEAHPEAARGR